MTEHEKSLLEAKIRKLEATKAYLFWVQKTVASAVNDIEMIQFDIREILDSHG